MANLKIPTQITGPDKIEVPLVRADHLETSNVFRTLFEIFLSVFSTTIGITFSIEKPAPIHYCFLTVMGIATLAFVFLTRYYVKKAKC